MSEIEFLPYHVLFKWEFQKNIITVLCHPIPSKKFYSCKKLPRLLEWTGRDWLLMIRLFESHYSHSKTIESH